MSRRNPYSSFLDNVQKPARYIGGEHYIQIKDWDQVVGKTALCFPDTYEIGMSHLGFKVLYEEINQHDHLLAERCFCPWIDMEKEMRDREVPLVTLENYRPLKDFDIVGFSLQYEMSYSNILNMLDLGQVPILQAERGENDPFVICGGPGATHPEPLTDFMDFIVVGDGEKHFSRILHFVGEARTEGLTRKQILAHLATWDGIYVPSFYDRQVDELSQLEVVTGPKGEYLGVAPEKAKRYFIESLKDYPFPTRSPIPHMTAIFDRFSVELARGCTEGCRFCQAGMIYRPVRERSPENVVDMVMDGLKRGGFNEASLTCLSTADYSAVTPLVVDLLDKLVEDRSTLGISSLRAYGLDKRVLDKLAEVKNASLTFAPEAGSERMRKVINKNVSEEDMLQTARDVFSRGWSKMKLYFMIGLPTETDEDVIAIMETARKAKKIAFECGVKNPTITVSVSTFVPKPHTPFQWAPMIGLDEIIRKQNLLWEYAKKYKLSFRRHFSKISYFEGIVSRGDRRVGEIIYSAWKKGARFDGWEETFDFDLWQEAVAESGYPIEASLGNIPLKGKLPWDHIDVGLRERFLEIEWKRAVKDRLSPPCGKIAGAIVHHSNLETLQKDYEIDKKKMVCYHCGIACDLKGMVEERKEFLTELNAVKDEPYVEPEVLKKDIKDLREKRGQFVGVKYRIEFSKIGPISFVSHLDLLKIMSRIFKRSEIDVLYSEGYKAKPLFAFGPALQLGVSSMTEFFDVRVPEVWEDEQAILAKLQENSETGITFRGIQRVEKKDKSIQAAINSFGFYVPVADDADIDQAIEKISNTKELVFDTYHPKTKKYVPKDIRPFIGSVEKMDSIPLDESVIPVIDEVSPCRTKRGVFVKTKITDGRSIKPMDIVKVMNYAGLQVEKPIKTHSYFM